MSNFKILSICWTVVWASCLSILGKSMVNFNSSTMPLIQLLTGNPTQAWTILPFYGFFVWILGVGAIAAALRVAKKFGGED